jgi:hypothetical protein
MDSAFVLDLSHSPFRVAVIHSPGIIIIVYNGI